MRRAVLIVKKYKRWGVNLFFLLCLCFSLSGTVLAAQAQELRFTRISTEQGLSQSKVYAICQDHQGFIWFGTEEGLNRYDGYNFTIFKHDPARTDSLSHNRVMSIHEDSSGTLWIGTLGGLHEFHRETETFTRYQADPSNLNSLSQNTVWTIYETRDQTLWIGTLNGGLNRFDRKRNVYPLSGRSERFRQPE